MSLLDYDLAVSSLIDFSPVSVGGLKKRVRDRKYYSYTTEDPAIRVETEGGYVFTRPRYRRNPLRRTFTMGYTDISPAQRQVLEDFWNSVQGGSFAFKWIDYDAMWSEIPSLYGQEGNVGQKQQYLRTVRFAGPMKIKTMNMGPVTRYNVEEITLKEV